MILISSYYSMKLTAQRSSIVKEILPLFRIQTNDILFAISATVNTDLIYLHSIQTVQIIFERNTCYLLLNIKKTSNNER